MSSLSSRRRSRIALACFTALSAVRSASAGQVPATWNGATSSGVPETRLWFNPNNWMPTVVPNDDVNNLYLVNVPSSLSVFVQGSASYPAAPVTVYDLNMNSNSVLNVYSPLTVADSLTASSATINVIGSNFSASTLAGNTLPAGNISVSSAGNASIGVASLDFSNASPSLSASGSGTNLDLHTAQTLSYGSGNFGTTINVSATGGGTVDLSGLTTIRRTQNNAGLTFTVSGGTLKLPNLQTINSDTSYLSSVTFNVTGQTFSLPDLTTARYTTFNPTSSATINLPALAHLSNSTITIPSGSTVNAPLVTDITQSSITLTSGATLVTGALSVLDGASIRLNANTSISNITATAIDESNTSPTLSADGSGTNLDLHTVQTLSYGSVNFGTTITVSATGGGTVDLSGLTTIRRTQNNAGLTFTVSGGTLKLPNLQTINSDTSYLSSVTFNVTGQTFSLPDLTTARYTTFNPTSSATINLPALAHLSNSTITIPSGSTVNAPLVTDITQSSITLTSGATLVTGALSVLDGASIRLNANTSISNITATAIDESNTSPTLSADGSGTNLDLHTVQTLSYGSGNFGTTINVSATGGGTVDLSGVTTIRRTANNASLNFTVSGGTLKLPNLQTINSDTSYLSSVTFNVTGQTFSLPDLTTARYTTFNPTSSATINLPALAHLSNSTITIPSGSTVNAPLVTDITQSSITLTSGATLVTGALSVLDGASIRLNANTSISNITATAIDESNTSPTLSADGSGTNLDLHTVQTLSYGSGNFGTTINVSATGGGTVDLSGLTTIRRTQNNAGLTFTVSGGTLKLPNLQTINSDTSYSSTAAFTVAGGGTMTLGSISVVHNASFTVADAGSKLSFLGSLNLGSSSSYSVATGATVSIGGNFSYANTSTSSFQAQNSILAMNGTTPQTLEVAGKDVGAVAPGNSGNFGFGQLVVGTATQPTEVDLTDTYDNGNRNGSGGTAEALYLFGSTSQNGLVLNDGSYLVLGNLNAYSYQNGAWVNLLSYIPAGQSVGTYNDGNGDVGYIVKNESALTAYYTAPGNGTFDNGANFSTNLTPQAINAVVISPSTGGIVVTGPAANASIRSLVVAGPVAGPSTIFNLAGPGVLSVSTSVQVQQQGTINVSGGRLTASSVTLSGGALNMTAGSLSAGALTNAGGTLAITGGNGIATSFTQTGGTSAFSAGIFTTPSVNFSGGSIGVSGTGQFIVTGGLNTTAIGATINLNGGTLSAGALNTSGNPSVLNWTTGTLAITGPSGVTWNGSSPIGTPTLSANKSLVITNNLAVPSGGVLTVAGGSVSAGTLALASGANLSLSAGNVSATAFIQTGGTFTQSGGTVSTSSFEIDGGTITSSAGSTTISGAYTQTGGTIVLTADTLTSATATLVGGTTYVLPGAQFSTTGSISVVAPGTLDIAGGLGQVGTSISIAPGGTVNVTGGTLNAQSVAVVGGTLNVSGGTVNLTGGTVSSGALIVGPNGTFADSGALSLTGPVVTLSGGTISTTALTASTTGLLNWTTGTLAITGAGGVTVGNSGPLGPSLTLSTGMTLSVAGTTTVSGQLNLAGGTLSTQTLSVAANGLFEIKSAASPAVRQLLVVPTITIASTGNVDLTNNDLDVTSGGLSAITASVARGYANGNWNGTGGIASSAAANSAHLTALGVIQNNQGGSPLFNSSHLFDGTVPGAADILVKYTYYGDANLDGRVDGSDYSEIDNGYLKHLSGWLNGDFNYDGVIDGSDYTLMDNAFNTQGAQLSSEIAVPTASIAEQVPDTSAVPEPGITGTIGVLALRCLGRRRRK